MEPQPGQRQSRIVNNVFYGAMTWVFPVILSLVATPVIVRALGVETYGIYALVLGLISYSFSFGIGRAATKYIAEYRISGEQAKIRGVISVTLVLGVVLGVFGVLLLFGTAEFLVTDVLRITETSRETTILAVYVSSAVIFVAIINQIFGSFVQGVQRFDLYSKLFNLNSFFLLSGNLLLALAGYGLLELLWWNLASLSLSTIFFFIAAKATVPEFRIGRFDRSSAKTVVAYTAGIVGYQVLANLLLLFERGWITRRFGSESLAFYAVAMSIGLYIHGFATSLLLTVSPLTSETQNDPERLLRLYRRSTKLIAFIVAFLCTMVVVHSRDFLLLWIGPDFAAEADGLLRIHTVTFGLLSIAGVAWFMREGLGVPKHNLYAFAICFSVTVPLMLLLSETNGPLGVSIARLAGFSIVFLSIVHFEIWLFGSILAKFWAELLIKLSGAVVGSALTGAFLLEYLGTSWPTFTVSVACSAAIYCVILWLLKFASPDEWLLARRFLGH